MFQGNTDELTVKKNTFGRRLVARFVRINPRAWRTLGQICMRMEIYVCQLYQGRLRRLLKTLVTDILSRCSGHKCVYRCVITMLQPFSLELSRMFKVCTSTKQDNYYFNVGHKPHGHDKFQSNDTDTSTSSNRDSSDVYDPEYKVSRHCDRKCG